MTDHGDWNPTPIWPAQSSKHKLSMVWHTFPRFHAERNVIGVSQLLPLTIQTVQTTAVASMTRPQTRMVRAHRHTPPCAYAIPPGPTL